MTRALFFAACMTLAACSPDQGNQASNNAVRRVVLITCDTLRADHLGSYGNAQGLTPHLDSLAAQSTRFERAHSTAPLTVPAVASLLSGLLPEENGTSGGNRRLMRKDVETLAERLEGAGWATAAVVSNWVLRRGDAPEQFGVHQGFDLFDDEMDSLEITRGKPERLAPATSAAALAVLDQFGKDDTQPLFLWVHYQDPHGPYTPPAEYAPDLGGVDSTRKLALGKNNSGHGQLPAYQQLDGLRHAGAYRALYAAEVRAFDAALGDLLTRLKSAPDWEQTLLIFSADHGESLGENDYWFCHGETLAQELLHVPLLVHFPGSGDDAPQAVRTDQSSHLDIVPTVLDELGLPFADLPGRALRQPTTAALPAVHQLGERGRPDSRIAATLDGWKSSDRSLGGTRSYSRLEAETERTVEREDLPADIADKLDRALDHMQRARAVQPETRRKASKANNRALNALGYAGDEKHD